MDAKEAVVKRINELCMKSGINYYTLSYRSAVPKSTLMNIIHGINPTIGTINKICGGLDITLKEFFNADYFASCEEKE